VQRGTAEKKYLDLGSKLPADLSSWTVADVLIWFDTNGFIVPRKYRKIFAGGPTGFDPPKHRANIEENAKKPKEAAPGIPMPKGKGAAEPVEAIEIDADGQLFEKPIGSGTVILFPGQGTQKPGMINHYLDAPGVAEIFKVAEEVYGFDLLPLCKDGPAEKLNDTRVSQPAVFLTSLASMYKMKMTDPTGFENCDVCAGFSLGEYTALVFAGAMDLRTALGLIKARGEAMADAAALEETGMVSIVGLDDAQIAQVCEKSGCSVANQLFPKGRVLSGKVSECKDAKLQADELQAIKTQLLRVSGGFHSKYMQPAADKLKEALAKCTMGSPHRTVYSNVSAKPYTGGGDEIKEKLALQLTTGVMWEDTVRDMLKANPTKYVEAAPGAQLKAMTRRIDNPAWKKTTNLEPKDPSKK